MENDNPVTKKRIEGRVAQILNARELVINRGSEHGVSLGMKFAILADEPIEIVDPETGDTLDVVDREKVTVKATEVKAKISICKTYRVTTIPGGSMYDLVTIPNPLRPPKQIVETLEVSSSSFPPPLSPDESYVKTMDRAIQVMDE